MPRPSYSPEQNDKIRSDIRAEAMKLFNAEGAEKLSLRKLAERMGIAHTKVYSYYKNKNDLFEALTVEMLGVLKQYLDDADDPDANPVLRLKYAARALLKFGTKHSDYYLFMFAAPRSATNPQLPGSSTRTSVFDHVVSLAQLAHEQGLIDRRPRTMANISWAMMHGLIMLELNGQLNEGRSFDELAETAIEMIFQSGG